MRKLVPVAAIAALTLTVAPAEARHFSPPPEAKAWIGTWHTSQGIFRFNEVYNCQSGPQYPGGEPGHPGGACALDGEWRHGGGSWQVILGNVALGPRYHGGSWEGCFRTPDAEPGHECTFAGGGDILLERLNDRFTEGYWKACGLGAGCESHHPIRGTKVSDSGGEEPECPAPPGAAEPAFGVGAGCPDYIVNFVVHVDGFPDQPDAASLPPDLATVDLQSFAGSLTWSPATKRWTPEGDIQMTDTYVDPQASPHVQDKQVTIQAKGQAVFAVRGHSRDVRFEVDVPSSEDPACPAGAEILMALATKPGADQFAIAQLGETSGTECLSSHALVWEAHRIAKATISLPVIAT